ncbi:hypothetical protein AYL99_01788 [Fonsecaea erecta]|uniref:ATP-grasp domain-containing protein n=1 Tax=Fonsecaea erecta TaxID=1367422 RepID=A0A178ZT29_9EURO|nr:hypothetical protein AYL99_01788 [Fonsecaea erecta]OAP62561.1 hypothetical protein AYL99_01788 [Fonsecaea erecta]
MDAAGITEALNVSAGMVWSPLPWNEESIQELELELERRLAFPWLSSKPVPTRRVCVVLLSNVSIPTTKIRWDTAAAMGVKVVVLSTGSWWKDDNGPCAHLREAFIDIDMTVDSGLSERIANAVKLYPQPIDGIFAISDVLLIPVAEAATQLGLWTSGPKPFTISTNKYLTRRILDPLSREYFWVDSVQALETRLASSDPVNFPLVCKPFQGRGSEGVFRADNAAQLRHAVSRALASKNGANVLVEPYVDGPEVDCNLVLLNGRILYSEVVDDFPCQADVAQDPSDKLFAETEAVVPSRLPAFEQHAIIDAVLDAVLLQGFDTGVFHCEARVRNSSMHYIVAEDATLPELEWNKKPIEITTETPSIFLHEVNARIPGIASSAVSMLARGIDFWTLQLLCAVSDWSRYEALSNPFGRDDRCDHAWLTNARELVTPKGIEAMYPGIPLDLLNNKMVDSNHNPIRELAKSHGDLTKYVLRHYANVKDAARYGFQEGEWLWGGCMVIVSPISRQHARHVAENIQDLYQDLVRQKYYVV